MYLDSKLKMSAAQAVTASAGSTDVLDLDVAREQGLHELKLLIGVDEAATAAGAATVTFHIQHDSDPAFGTAKTVIKTDAIAKAELIIGKQIILPIPAGLNKRYMRVYYEVATGPLTAGKFSATVIEGEQLWSATKAQQ